MWTLESGMAVLNYFHLTVIPSLPINIVSKKREAGTNDWCAESPENYLKFVTTHKTSKSSLFNRWPSRHLILALGLFQWLCLLLSIKTLFSQSEEIPLKSC